MSLPRWSTRRKVSTAVASRPGELLLLAGRVLACAPPAERFVLADDSGTLELELQGEPGASEGPPGGGTASSGRASGDLPRPGDLVWLRARRTERGVSAIEIHLLTRYGRSEPFPSPGGEFFRLHGRPVSREAMLVLRSRCLGAIRSFFDERGYLEVQTPLRVRSPGLEPHLRAEPAGPGRYLITSPEYQMKRLLAGGLERIFFLGPCWRGDELGAQHLGEFCMLEWYRAYSSLPDLMSETEELVAHVARQALKTLLHTYRGQALCLEPPFLRLPLGRAFEEMAGVKIRGVVQADELRARAMRAGLGPFAPDEPFEAIASRILVERVEPALAVMDRPVFLLDFPAPMAALSRLREDDPTVAERLELYAGGLELANAFGELTDPEEQLARLRADQEQRRRDGAEVYPVDERFLDALREGIPPAAGIALGVDRLVMLLGDAPDIREVVAFGPDEV